MGTKRIPGRVLHQGCTRHGPLWRSHTNQSTFELRPFKLERKGFSPEADLFRLESNLNVAAKCVYIYIYNSSWVDTTFSYAAVGLACFSLKLGCVLCVSARAWFLWSVAICSSARVTDSCFVHWILYPSHRTDFRYPFDYKEYPPCPNWWYMWRGSVWLLSHNQSTSVRMFPASLEKKSCCPKRRNMLDSEYI